MNDSPPTFWQRFGKWILLGLALVAIGFVWHFFPVKAWVQAFSSWVEAHGFFGYLLFILAYAIATVFFFPGSVLTIAAGLAFGLWRGFVVVSLGATLGAALAFLVSRYFIRSRVEKAAKENPKFAAMDEAIGREGWKMVALLRLSPLLPFNLSNYLFGVTRVGFWPYVAASWAGMLPGTLLYVYLGAAGKEASAGGGGPLKWTFFGAGLLATAFVTVWVSRLAKKAVPQSSREKSTAEKIS